MANHSEAALDALGDPSRRRILERLAQGPMPVNQIAAGLQISRPAVSQHLKVLRLAGLVADRAEGTRRLYQLHPAGLRAPRAWLDRLQERAPAAAPAPAAREPRAERRPAEAVAPPPPRFFTPDLDWVD